MRRASSLVRLFRTIGGIALGMSVVGLASAQAYSPLGRALDINAIAAAPVVCPSWDDILRHTWTALAGHSWDFGLPESCSPGRTTLGGMISTIALMLALGLMLKAVLQGARPRSPATMTPPPVRKGWQTWPWATLLGVPLLLAVWFVMGWTYDPIYGMAV